jgi:hypothetical protein
MDLLFILDPLATYACARDGTLYKGHKGSFFTNYGMTKAAGQLFGMAEIDLSLQIWLSHRLKGALKGALAARGQFFSGC